MVVSAAVESTINGLVTATIAILGMVMFYAQGRLLKT